MDEFWKVDFEPQTLSCTGSSARPYYGWNVLRWLFRRPIYWTIVMSYEYRPRAEAKE